MQTQKVNLPEWYYRERRPPNDEAYFENLCRIVFEAGLNWKMIDHKWALTRRAFANFSVVKVAHFTKMDVEHLMNCEGVLRNRGKIQAIIQHAIQFREIKRTFGSFQKFLDSQDKSNDYVKVIKELGRRFRWLTPDMAKLFLYSVGENIKQPKGIG